MKQDLTVWKIIEDLSGGKKEIIRTSENPEKAWKQYIPFVVNKGFSFFPDTVMAANIMNRYPDIPEYMQHDFYMKTVRAKKRYYKWPKKQNSELIELVSRSYNINKERAREYLSLLNDEQIEQLKRLDYKGGKE